MNPEWLRYYIAAKLNAQVEDIDFNPEDFVARVNSDLVGKYVNIASRAAGFLAKRFDGQLSADVGVEGRALLDSLRAPSPTRSRPLYEEREFGKALREVMAAGRSRQRVRRPAQALGAGEGCVQARRIASRLQRCAACVLHADGVPRAVAARHGGAHRA